MNINNSRCVAFVVLGCILTFDLQAGAGWIGDHTEVVVKGAGSNGVGGPGKASYQKSQTGGAAAEVEGAGTGTGNALQVVSSSATTSPFGPALMRLEANAFDNGAGSFISASASATGQWRDIVFYGGDQAPSSLRLVFRAEGTFEASLVSDFYKYYSRNKLSIAASSDIDRFPVNNGLLKQARVSYAIGKLDGEYTWRGGWTSEGFESLSYNPEDGRFSGIFIYDAPYDGELGGYKWYVTMTASSSTYGGSGSALLGNTIALQAVTLIDGTAIDPAELSFDSGLKLSTVPEPSSIVMLGAGALGLLGCRGCRRRRGGNGNR